MGRTNSGWPRSDWITRGSGVRSFSSRRSTASGQPAAAARDTKSWDQASKAASPDWVTGPEGWDVGMGDTGSARPARLDSRNSLRSMSPPGWRRARAFVDFSGSGPYMPALSNAPAGAGPMAAPAARETPP